MTDYKTRALHPSDIRTAEQWRRDIVIRPDGAVTIEDVLKPTFWAHVGKMLEMFATIEVQPLNHSFWAQILVSKLIVTSTGDKIPSFTVLQHHELKASVKEPEPAKGETAFQSDTYRVEWKGPQAKFCIIRSEDRHMVEKNIASKPDAINRVRELEAA